jgi:hypothetical protein
MLTSRMTTAIRLGTPSVLGSVCRSVVERQHLPDGTAVDLGDQPLKTVHAATQRPEGCGLETYRTLRWRSGKQAATTTASPLKLARIAITSPSPVTRQPE